MDEFTAEDWAMLATMGNDIGLQWYMATHGQQLPSQMGGARVSLPGISAGITGQQIVLLVLGGLALVMLLRK